MINQTVSQKTFRAEILLAFTF